ncbi:MAG TPA: hypothetical protein VEC36_07845 [Patescibacteria group bacterium]|nr:hypothetical protein [Patescibacteria group bacterium]
MNGCEVFRIGAEPKPVPLKADQNSPFGAVYLFKKELDTNNASAAAQILAKPKGERYLAIEKVEMYDEVARIGRLINNMPITNVSASVVSGSEQFLKVEFDYFRIMTFSTVKIGENWFISGISEW